MSNSSQEGEKSPVNENTSVINCEALRRLADEFRTRYDTSYASIDTSLELGPIGISLLNEILTPVCIRLFDLDTSQSMCDWGRVIALVVFASSLSLECHRRNRPHLDSHIRFWVTSFFSQNPVAREWIELNDGWVS